MKSSQMDEEDDITKWLKLRTDEDSTAGLSPVDVWLKTCMEQVLGEIVASKVAEVERADVETKSQDELSDAICQSLLLSPEMTAFKENILKSESPRTRRGPILVNNPGAESWLQPMPDQLHQRLHSKNLTTAMASPGQPQNQRVKALEFLKRAPMGDIILNGTWRQLQQTLHEGLCDENREVFSLVLQVHARLLSSSTASPVKESFLSLLEGLAVHYLSHWPHQTIPSTSHGIDISNFTHLRIIQIANTVLRALCNISRKWIRFGEKRVEDIIENFLDLLSMYAVSSSGSRPRDQGRDMAYPFQIVSVLDPEAKWCSNLTHAAFSRIILIRCLAKRTSFLRFIVEEVVLWFESHMKPSPNTTVIPEDSTAGNVSGSMVALTIFIHCLSLIRILANSERGCSLFPIHTGSGGCGALEEPVTLQAIILKALNFLNRQACTNGQPSCKRVVELIEETITSLLCSKGAGILSATGGSRELSQLLLEPCGNQGSLYLHKHCISILDNLSNPDRAGISALGWMLKRHERRTQPIYFRSLSESRSVLSSASSYRGGGGGGESLSARYSPGIASTVADCTMQALSDRQTLLSSPENSAPTIMLLNLCQKLFSSVDGYLVLESNHSKLVPLSGNLYIHLDESANSCFTNNKYKQSFAPLHRGLENLLIAISRTPLGYLAITDVPGLASRLVASYSDRPWAAWNNPQVIQLMQMLAVHSNINLASHRNTLLSYALNQLWTSCKNETSWTSLWQEELSTFLSRLLALCVTPKVVLEMLAHSDSEDDSSDATLVEEAQETPFLTIGSNEPSTLTDLFSSGLQVSTPVYVHRVSLLALHALSHHIDMCVVLQNRLGIQDILMKLQTEQMTGTNISTAVMGDGQLSPRMQRDSNLIRDECTQLRHHILVLLQQIQDNGTCHLSSMPSMWIPASPQPRSCRLRVHTDLQKFLQDTRLGLHDNMWLTHARRAYRTSSHLELKVPVLLDLLEQVQRGSAHQNSVGWPSHAERQVCGEQFTLPIQIVVRYGCQQKVLNPNSASQHCEQLAQLLDQSLTFLCKFAQVEDFDWFVASVFLMCAGNIERSRCILQRVVQLPNGPLIWPMLSKALGQPSLESKLALAQQLQALIAKYLPESYSMVQEAGVLWWHVTERLNEQAFMSALPLAQLPHILALCTMHTWEYVLYLRMSFLVHLQPSLHNAAVLGHLHCFLGEMPLQNWVINDYLSFMDRLAKVNRPPVIKDKAHISTL